jgi:hypothetical protein
MNSMPISRAKEEELDTVQEQNEKTKRRLHQARHHQGRIG